MIVIFFPLFLRFHLLYFKSIIWVVLLDKPMKLQKPQKKVNKKPNESCFIYNCWEKTVDFLLLWNYYICPLIEYKTLHRLLQQWSYRSNDSIDNILQNVPQNLSDYIIVSTVRVYMLDHGFLKRSDARSYSNEEYCRT